MPVGGADSYFIRGAHPEEDADSLEEALLMLVMKWDTQPTLEVHDMGNLVITLTIGNEQVTLEITDPVVLQDLREVGPQAIIDHIVANMDVPAQDARELLGEARASVRVDTIRMPDVDAWQPGLNPTFDLGAPGAREAMSEGTPRLLGEVLREADREERRGPRRRRTERAAKALELLVRSGRQAGLSDAQIARASGVPRSTVRDARIRMDRSAVAKADLAGRPAGQRLTPEQRSAVQSELKRTRGNAAQAARNLGLAPRTVREIRARGAAPAPRRTYSTQDRQALVDTVRRTGVSATEAGRQLGVPPRTAREWVHDAKRRK